ncbi:hypothetical protein [Streptomyces eurythermus]|uniref:hypothetical protein n=1 Tax=Streptomyces eurythermus TaxID=42237 RepID=UPI0036D365A6
MAAVSGTHARDRAAGDAGAVSLVAGFRESVGTDTDDPRFVELVGELTLNREKFLFSGSSGLLLVLYHADRDSDSDEKLRLLSSYQTVPRIPAPADSPVPWLSWASPGAGYG